MAQGPAEEGRLRLTRGLTLLELVLVLVILAVAGAVAMPYYLASLPNRRAAAATRQVLTDLRRARTLAVESGEPVYVVFEVGTSAYRIVREADGVAGPSAGDEMDREVALTDQFPGVVLGSTVVADPVTFQNDVAVFRPRGTSNGGSVVLRVPGRSTAERKVAVLSTTGRVRAYTWNPGTGRWE